MRYACHAKRRRDFPAILFRQLYPATVAAKLLNCLDLFGIYLLFFLHEKSRIAMLLCGVFIGKRVNGKIATPKYKKMV